MEIKTKEDLINLLTTQATELSELRKELDSIKEENNQGKNKEEGKENNGEENKEGKENEEEITEEEIDEIDKLLNIE